MPASARFSAHFLARCLLALALTLGLSACGFHLRGPQPLVFKSINLGMSPYSDMYADLKRRIKASGTTEVDDTGNAEVRLLVTQDSQEKVILSLGGAGTVQQYQLKRHFQFKLQDKAGHELMSLVKIELSRDITYNDAIKLAKDQEEAMLYRDMQEDLEGQIMRRLAAVRMNPAPAASAPAAN